MMESSHVRLYLIFVVVISIVSQNRIVAQELRDDKQSVRIVALIQQLGADQFAQRQIAARELESIGEPAIMPLRRVLDSPDQRDPEIRLSAEQLLIKIQRAVAKQRIEDFLEAGSGDTNDYGLGGWPQFSEMVGSGKNARKMFVAMHNAHEELFEAFFQGFDEIESAFEDASNSARRRSISTGRLLDSLCCLMFVAACEFRKSDNVLATVEIADTKNQRIASRLNRAETVTYVKSCANKQEIETLINLWLNTQSVASLPLVNARLLITHNYELSGQLGYLVELVKLNEIPIQSRVRGLELLAELGDASVIEPLQSLLADGAMFGSFPHPDLSGEQIDIQFRDFVLATCVHLAGLKPAKFGYWIDEKSKAAFTRTKTGFTNDLLRQKALARWREANSQVGSSASED